MVCGGRDVDYKDVVSVRIDVKDKCVIALFLAMCSTSA